MSTLADALAVALPPAVLERLCDDLDREPATSATLVLELASARRRSSEADLRARYVVDGRLPHRGRDREAIWPAQPQGILSDLAAHLSELSIKFEKSGDRGSALAASMQSVSIYCALARNQPSVHLSDLAASLNNVGVDYIGLDRAQDACAAIEQSVAIRRVLAGKQPELYLKGLAISLNNYGACLTRLNRAKEALAASREAAQIRLWLAEHSPEAFLPSLASTLTNMGINLANLGRLSEAAALGRLATDICNRIAVARRRVGQSGDHPTDGTETTDAAKGFR